MDLLALWIGLVAGGLALAGSGWAGGRWIWRHLRRQRDPGVGTKEDIAQLKQTVEALRGEISTYLDGLAQAKGEVRDHFEEGRRLQHAEHHDAAIAELEKAFAAAANDSQRSALHLLIANSLLLTGRFPEAGGRYRQALDAAERANDRQAQAAALGNLGIVYRQRGQLNKAEHHFTRALAIDEETGDRLGQAKALGNLGNVYSDRGQLDRAEEQYKRALEMHKQIGNPLGQAHDLCNLGTLYGRRRDLDEAEEHHKKALQIDEEIGNKLGQADDLGNLGLLAGQRGQLQKARQLLSQAQALYAEIGAGGEGPDTVRAALEHLEGITPPKPKPKRKRPRKKRPPKKP